MKSITLALLILCFASLGAQAQGGHEYSPLQEKTVDYKNWAFKSLKDGKPADLRSLSQGKKLVMVLYFAPWCPNWRNEAPVAAGLYEKYKGQGFEIIGVSEYGPRDDVRAFFGPSGPAFPIVTESESRDDRDKTTHYVYPQLPAATRRRGSPWHTFLVPATSNSTAALP